MPSQLAINGGPKIREIPMPPRALFGEDEKQAAVRVFDEAIAAGQAFGYGGKYEQAYEEKFCAFMGGGYADAVNSGTNALFVALGALQLNPTSEVIVPPITDPGGVMPVVMLNCVPVIADCDPRSYNTGPDQIKSVMSARTRAIIVAHIGGDPVDMDPVLEIARQYHVAVIEDCAQAHGAEYKGKKVGTFGDIAVFSTMNGKHHATGGQGGVVYTRNEALYWKVKRFADRGKPFGLEGIDSNVVAGLNCNLNELSAAIGCVQLDKLPGIIKRRRKIGSNIREALKDNKAVFVGWQTPQSRSAYWFLRVGIRPEFLTVNKQQFVEAVMAEGIPANPNYRNCAADAIWFKQKAVYGSAGCPWNCPWYKGRRDPVFALKNMVSVTDTHFNIAIHENYGDQEIHDIIAVLTKVEQEYRKDVC